MSIKVEVNVKGCGCRFRDQIAEYLCDSHKDEWILKLYNAQTVVKQMRQERIKKMDEVVKKNKDLIRTGSDKHYSINKANNKQ